MFNCPTFIKKNYLNSLINKVKYFGIWQRINNPSFNYGEYTTIRN